MLGTSQHSWLHPVLWHSGNSGGRAGKLRAIFPSRTIRTLHVSSTAPIHAQSFGIPSSAYAAAVLAVKSLHPCHICINIAGCSSYHNARHDHTDMLAGYCMACIPYLASPIACVADTLKDKASKAKDSFFDVLNLHDPGLQKLAGDVVGNTTSAEQPFNSTTSTGGVGSYAASDAQQQNVDNEEQDKGKNEAEDGVGTDGQREGHEEL